RPGGEATPWLRLLLSPAFWLLSVQQFFRAGANVFFATWFPTFLQDTRGLGRASAAAWASLPALAAIFAGPAGGWLSDFVLARTGSRRAARQGLSLASNALCVACFALTFLCRDAA